MTKVKKIIIEKLFEQLQSALPTNGTLQCRVAEKKIEDGKLGLIVVNGLQYVTRTNFWIRS